MLEKQAANCNNTSKVCNSEYILEKKNIILLVSGCILFAFFLAFFIINDNISHKEESNGYSGRIIRPKNRGKEKKHEMQYFLWIIYQFWGFFLLFCGRKIFSKTKSLFPTFHNSTIQCSYPFGDDYYNGFFTINYMIDFLGNFAKLKCLMKNFGLFLKQNCQIKSEDFQNQKK